MILASFVFIEVKSKMNYSARQRTTFTFNIIKLNNDGIPTHLFVPLTWVVEDTFARESKEKQVFLWLSAHLFVPLQQ